MTKIIQARLKKSNNLRSNIWSVWGAYKLLHSKQNKWKIFRSPLKRRIFNSRKQFFFNLRNLRTQFFSLSNKRFKGLYAEVNNQLKHSNSNLVKNSNLVLFNLYQINFDFNYSNLFLIKKNNKIFFLNPKKVHSTMEKSFNYYFNKFNFILKEYLMISLMKEKLINYSFNLINIIYNYKFNIFIKNELKNIKSKKKATQLHILYDNLDKIKKNLNLDYSFIYRVDRFYPITKFFKLESSSYFDENKDKNLTFSNINQKNVFPSKFLYSLSLKEKQKFRLYYGFFKDKYFKELFLNDITNFKSKYFPIFLKKRYQSYLNNYFPIIKKSNLKKLYNIELDLRNIPLKNISMSIETRLDVLLMRAGFAHTIQYARQLINHKHVLVNGKIINIIHYNIKKGDIVSINPKSKDNVKLYLLNNLLNKNILICPTPNLEVNYKLLTFVFCDYIDIKDISYPFKINLDLIKYYYQYN